MRSESERRLRLPRWAREVLLIGVLYTAYEFSRGVHKGTFTTATRNGRHLLHWERVLHIDPESALSNALDGVHELAVPAAYFYSTMHYVITPVVLIWLYLRHYDVYRPARTSLAITTVIGLLGFYLFPTAPPRLLAGSGIPDVLYDVRNFGWWGGDGSVPRGFSSVTNQFAAMPSLHVGWALWCGVLIYRHASHTWLRWLGLVYPMVTTLVVLSTGNHYLLDAVAGALATGIGALLTVASTDLRRRIGASWTARRSGTAPADRTADAAAPDTVATPAPAPVARPVATHRVLDDVGADDDAHASYRR